MVFSSYVFLFVFLPLVLGLYYLAPKGWRTAVLTLASYVFYGWWRVDFVALMLISTAVDFTCGKRIHASTGRARGAYLFVSVLVNLGLLGYFKYVNFGIDSLNAALAVAGVDGLWWPEVVLPVGISFYTFQTMSYSIDIYRGVARPQERLVDFACYVALFPQLVAGPIVRYNTFEDQLRARTTTLSKFARGAIFFQLGLAKKVLLADSLAPVADAAFGASLDGGAPSMAVAWIGALAYTFQIYFDFSGYSDMAIGLGLLFGFVYPENFDGPYRSRSITEFWRRWHISLSTWLRDYLYVPLGGNRRGPVRTYVNLALTMLLGGLWHGAAAQFVVWGAYQGAWLVAERALGKRALWSALPGALRVAPTFVVVVVGWVIFRSEDFGSMGRYLGALVGLGADGGGLFPVHLGRSTLLAFAAAAGACWLGRTTQVLARRPGPLVAALALLAFLAALAQVGFQAYSPFLYFQF